MNTLGFHIRFRLLDDRVIAPTIAARRILARTILELGRDHGLYAFGCADTHVHLAARVDRATAGRLTGAIESSLRQRLALPVGFTQHPPKPIVDQHHLIGTIRYVLRQLSRHGVSSDPRSEGTSLPDLLGLRLIGAYTRTNMQRWLPRLGLPDWLEALGVTELAPADGPLGRILPAALAAGCRTDLAGSRPEVVALRGAIVAVIGDRLTTREIAALLHKTPRAIQLLRKRPVDEELAQAIRLQLGLALPFEDAGGPLTRSALVGHSTDPWTTQLDKR